jgi:putative phage-type endonuclease
LRERAKGITASDVSAILGLSPYKTPFKVWAEKTKVLDDDFQESERMKWGSRLEAGIALGWAEEKGLEVKQCGDLIAHPKHDWLMATPDFFVNDGSILEIKNTGKYWEWKDNQTPDHAHIQVVIQLACTEADLAHIAALITGNKLEHRIFTRELELEDMIITKLAEFKGLIDSRTAPPLQSEDLGAVSEMYSSGRDGSSLNLDDSWLFKIEKYLELKAKIKGLEEEKDLIEANLKATLKDNTMGQCGPYSLSWKNESRAGYTVQPTTFRKFLIKALKTK